MGKAAATLPLLLATCLTWPFAPSAMASTPAPITLISFRDQLAAAQQVLQACREGGAGCRPEAVPADADVAGEPTHPAFHAGWQWLRNTLGEAAKAPPGRRNELLQQADTHLAAELRAVGNEAAAPAVTPAALNTAHAAAVRVLSGEEFLAAPGPTWLDRLLGRLQELLSRVFAGMDRVGSRNPWVAPLLEWVCFGLAAAGLLVSVYRSLRRQSVRLALEGAGAAAELAPATDWAARAEAAERAGHWREALHAVYWAAISGLEARRVWRGDPTRTPREYLRLLRPDSQAHAALRGLTQRFERSWYGLNSPGPAEVEAGKRELGVLLQTDGGGSRIAATTGRGTAHAPGGAA